MNDDKIHIQFGLNKLEMFPGTDHGYPVDDLGTCEITVTSGENDVNRHPEHCAQQA